MKARLEQVTRLKRNKRTPHLAWNGTAWSVLLPETMGAGHVYSIQSWLFERRSLPPPYAWRDSGEVARRTRRCRRCFGSGREGLSIPRTCRLCFGSGVVYS